MTVTDGAGETGRAERSAPLRLISVSALVALVTNALQWWHGSVETQKLMQETQNLQAERDKIVAEVQQMQREQAEGASRSIQSWLDQLLKFSQPEDKVMVLSALLSTTPDESIKAWAREQMKRLEGQIDSRQKEAEEKLAVAVRAAPDTSRLPASGPSEVGAGGAQGSINGSGGSTQGPLPAATRDPRIAAVQLATGNLERLKRAQSLLLDADRTAPRPITRRAAPDGVRPVPLPRGAGGAAGGAD